MGFLFPIISSIFTGLYLSTHCKELILKYIRDYSLILCKMLSINIKTLSWVLEFTLNV